MFFSPRELELLGVDAPYAPVIRLGKSAQLKTSISDLLMLHFIDRIFG